MGDASRHPLHVGRPSGAGADFEQGAVLTPALAVGGRYDGGAAESGAGLLLSGRLGYALPAWG